MKNNPIILFDGVCNLCNDSVQFIIRQDKSEKFLFASLQSDFAEEKMKQFGLDNSSLDTVVLIDGDRVFTRSSAGLEVLKRLGGLWQLFYAFIIIPAPVRNIIYDWIARNRYRWFGKKDECMIPTPELKKRFL